MQSMYILAFIFLLAVPSSFQIHEMELMNHLLQGYSRFVRPVRNITKPLVITFGIELIHLTSIVEKEQLISSKLWIRITWYNELMMWNPKDWGNITSSRLDYDTVWTPDIFLQEDMTTDMAKGPERYKTKIRIQSNGKHQWLIPAFSKSSCIFEVHDFPYDHQHCTLTFTSWTHDQSEIDIKADTRPIITGHYVNSSQWDLIDIKREVRSTFYACCRNPFVDIKFTMQLHRKPLYYIYNIVVPCIIQILIILFTFYIPPESGERIGIVITVLLVFAVYLEVLSQDLPKTSTSTPALARFAIAAMAGSALSIIATCIVLIFHFKSKEQGVSPIPGWVRRCFINYIGKHLCIRPNLQTPARKKSGKYLSCANMNTLETQQDGENDENVQENQISKQRNMETLLDELHVVTKLIDDMNIRDEVMGEWELLAKIFDRIFFIMFFVMFVGSSLSTLLYRVMLK